MNRAKMILAIGIWLSVTLSLACSEELMMEEITVTGTRMEEEVFNVPAAVSVADRTKMDRELPGAAAETLRDIAGIWVQKTGHNGGAPIIRGLMGNQILILVDGVRQNNLNLFAGPNSFLNTFDPEDIERIEVIKGPGSVLYGTDALGGVVHIITKRNKSFSERPWIAPLISTRLGSVDRSASGRFELKGSWKRFNFLLGSTFKRVGDLRGGGDIGVQSPSSWKERNFDLSSSLKLTEKQFMDLSLQSFHRYDVTRFDRPTWISEGKRRLLNLVYRGRDMGQYLQQIKFNIAFHDQERGRSHTKKFDNKFSDTETLQTELQITSQIGSQRLIYGLHYHHDSTSGWRETKKGKSINPNATWDNFAVFFQDEISMFDRVRLTPAVRWDRYLLKREKDPGNPRDIGVEQKSSALTGSLGAVLTLTDFLNLTASVGRGFRAPNNSDYRSAPSLFTYGVGVPTVETLKPEKSMNYEIGVRVKHRKLQASLAAYYMRITDLISSVKGTYQGKDWYDWDGDGERDPDETVFVKKNVGEAKIYGTEITVQYPITDSLSALASLSWMDGWNITKDEPLGRATPTNGTLRLLYVEPRNRRFWAEFSTRIVSRFDSSKVPKDRLERDPAFKVNPQDRKSPLLSGDGSVPGYTLFNVRGGVRISDNLRLTFGVENILDKAYRDKDSRIDGPGRNFVVGINAGL